MSRRAPALAAATLLGAFAAACVAAERPTASTDRHPILVRETRETLELPPTALVTRQTRDGAAVLAFAEVYQRRGRRGVTIATPAAFSGGAAAAADQAAALLASAGLSPSELQTVAYDPQGRIDPPVVLMFDAYVAEAPPCFSTFGDLTETYSGAAHASFGCAVQANLAAMLVDPSDLLGPRPLDPIDPGRRLVVIEKYRSGETTTTQRGDDEAAAVSDAVE